MFLKKTRKGNKSSEAEDNTASREATTETIPLFIYFNSSPTFKAIKTATSACSALQILLLSLCSVYGNKWTFPPFQLKFVGPLPWPSTPHRQKGARTPHHHSALKHCSSTPNAAIPGKETPQHLSTSSQQGLTEQGTAWGTNVTLEYTPQAALGSVPTLLV